MNEKKWLRCADPTAMLEFIRGKATVRKLRLCACACVSQILPLAKLAPEQVRTALAEIEQFADGGSTKAAMKGVRERMANVRASNPPVRETADDFVCYAIEYLAREKDYLRVVGYTARLVRGGFWGGPLTTQAPPLANGQPDPNRAIRPEKPAELAAKVSDGEVSVVIPPELPADSYQVAVQVELLSPDKQKVLATAVTPVRTLPVRLPVTLKADGTKLDAKLDPKTGASVELRGAVARQNGFAGDVTVSLAGLPPGVTAPAPVTLKSRSGPKFAFRLRLPLAPGAMTVRSPAEDETKFAFKLTFPPTTPAGEVRLKLSATVAPDPKQPNVRVKGRDAELTLNILPPPK